MANSNLRTYYYHDKGLDNNGNGGPDVAGPGWLAAVGRNADDAATRLPKDAQKKLARELARYRKENGVSGMTLQTAMEDTCTWGWCCSFMGQDDWESELDNAGICSSL